MNVFDIIGPVMIGPSSSHTAGAVRIGRVAMKILGEKVARADIELAGSFADTGQGHGTDRALIAGLLGMNTDDERIPASFDEAGRAGLEFSFTKISLPRSHPNTARLHLKGKDGGVCNVEGASVGGGNILITSINGKETQFTGAEDTLIIPHKDQPGMIAAVAKVLTDFNINIGNFKLNRPQKGFEAVMVVEVDGTMNNAALDILRELPNITSVVYLRKIGE
jgi:L-serine dehydratase